MPLSNSSAFIYIWVVLKPSTDEVEVFLAQFIFYMSYLSLFVVENVKKTTYLNKVHFGRFGFQCHLHHSILHQIGEGDCYIVWYELIPQVHMR